MPSPTRRALLAMAAMAPLLPVPARANEIIDLEWADLAPEGQDTVPSGVRALFQHDETAEPGQQPMSGGVRTDWNGKVIRLPGFIVPLDFNGAMVSTFLLVPFVGACVHVPPPPSNQLVFVTNKTPFESSGMFEAVEVTGLFATTQTTTELAEVGYVMAADRIEPYG